MNNEPFCYSSVESKTLCIRNMEGGWVQIKTFPVIQNYDTINFKFESSGGNFEAFFIDPATNQRTSDKSYPLKNGLNKIPIED